MNASFSNNLTVPEGFPDVLRNFTRELLRDQPNNLYTYGAEYFAALAANQNTETSSSNNNNNTIDMEMLESRLRDMFSASDEEGKGYLSRQQATAVVNNVAAELSFNEKQIEYIMSEADANHDNMIEWNEFLPLMLELVQLLVSKADVEAKLMENEAMVEDKLLHGMDRETLNNLLLSIFQAADVDGSGALDAVEFSNALRSADLGLTKKEIGAIEHVVDRDENGEISYTEFAPVAFDLCVRIYARQVAHEALPTGEKEISDYLQQLFESADVDGVGRLTHTQIKELLQSSDLGMSRIQIHAVLGNAIQDEETKTINYLEFADVAATQIGSLMNFEDQAERLQYRNEFDGTINGMDESAFKNAIVGALQAMAGDRPTLSLDSIQEAVFTGRFIKTLFYNINYRYSTFSQFFFFFFFFFRSFLSSTSRM